MMNIATRTARRFAWSLAVPALLTASGSCTKLTEVPHDALTPDNAFHSQSEILAGVAGVSSTLRAVEWVGYLTLEDLTTDMSIVPTRGSDWYDNGQWLDLHRQTWTANSSGTLAFLNGTWNDLFSGVAKANLMIDVVNTSTSTTKARTLAELRTLRAWYMYMLQDMFGGVPVVTGTEAKRYARANRDSVFKFIESELVASVADLPASWPADGYGRLTKGAANSILASL